MKKAILLFICSLALNSVNAQGWSEFGTGLAGLNANGQIISIVNDNTGTVYTSGAFVLSGARNVYKWGSTHWESVGSQNASWWYATMCTDATNNLYTAGAFYGPTRKRYVAKWNGSTWGQLGVGVNQLNADSTIWSICSDPAGNIYAAGEFKNATGYRYVAKWNGSGWSELGAGAGALNANGTIRSICIDPSGNVYAGGYFIDGAGYFVAMYTPSSNSWSKISPALNGAVYALAADKDGYVYAGGFFTNSNGHAYVGRWDGAMWTELGTGANDINASGYIMALGVGKNGDVYVGGSLTNAMGKQYVAYWNGTSWSELGESTVPLSANSNIFTVHADTISGFVYAAGNFTNSNGKFYVAKHQMPEPVITSVSQQATKNSISIHPNPATSEVNIEVSNIDKNATISITDVTGRTLLQKNVSAHSGSASASFDISSLANGLYLVSVKTGTEQHISKLIKN